MPGKKTSRMVYFIIFIILVLLIIFLAGTVKVYRFLHPKVYLPHGEVHPVNDYTAGDYTPDKIVFKSTDGLDTVGLFYSCGEMKAPCVIIAHGYASRMGIYPERMLKMLEKGWHVFTFDFRGHGESTFPRTSIGLREYHDLSGALEYLHSRNDVDPGRIAIWGNSMGAVTAIKSITKGRDIRAIVADSPFQNLVNNFSFRFRQKNMPLPLVYYMLFLMGLIARGNLFSNNTARYLSSFDDVPILFIHGDKDRDVEIKASENLYNIYSGPKEFLKLPGVDHYNHDEVPGYLEKSIQFLEKNLK